MVTPLRPGGAISNRPLHFFWLVDCSGSMAGDKIQTLNHAIRSALPEMVKAAESNPTAQVLVRVIRFATSAGWHVAQPTPVESFSWADVSAEGVTSTGKALSLLAEQLKMPPMPERALPPVIVLVSDGQSTDDFNAGLRALMDQPWGKRAVRIAIAVGDDADKDELQKFIGHSENKPLEAKNSEDLVTYIRWVSSVVVKSASAPASQAAAAGPVVGPVPIPAPPPPSTSSAVGDVW